MFDVFERLYAITVCPAAVQEPSCSIRIAVLGAPAATGPYRRAQPVDASQSWYRATGRVYSGSFSARAPSGLLFEAGRRAEVGRLCPLLSQLGGERGLHRVYVGVDDKEAKPELPLGLEV